MAICIITDSTADLTAAEAAELGITVVPLSVRFGDEEFLDGIDLQKEAFFRRLAEAEELPTTSQVSPGTLKGVFCEALERGDEVLGVFLSGALSGTYQSAEIAKGLVGSPHIHLVDSRTITFGLQLLVRCAARRRDAGKSAAEIQEELRDMVPRQRFLGIVQTLKYLKMGGRISASTAILGGVLGICPLIGLVDGKVEAVGKVKGRPAGYRRMLELLEEAPPDEDYPLAFGSTNAPELMTECREAIAEKRGDFEAITGEIGCIIGVHAGPGCVGIAYIAKK